MQMSKVRENIFIGGNNDAIALPYADMNCSFSSGPQSEACLTNGIYLISVLSVLMSIMSMTRLVTYNLPALKKTCSL